jgi:uncharacterized protein YjeT (DUF2065 family)
VGLIISFEYWLPFGNPTWLWLWLWTRTDELTSAHLRIAGLGVTITAIGEQK